MAWFACRDIIERLNFLWSCVILLVFALFIGFLRYFYLESLITCWTPAHFTIPHNHYTLQKCWEKNETLIAEPEDIFIPVNTLDRNKFEVIHTWIPILALLMIIGFKIPEGVKILFDFLTGSKQSLSMVSIDSWEGRAEYLAQAGRDIVNKGGLVKTLSYLFIQMLMCANLLAQFIFTRFHLKDSVKTAIVDDKEINITRLMFPKTIICVFEIRQFSNLKAHSIQCDLPVNRLYEVFLQAFSVWILLVGLVTAIAFAVQFFTLLVPFFVKIRFRGIIPDRELNLRGCSVDDVLLFLEDIRDEFGVGMARHVASKIWALDGGMRVPVHYEMNRGGDGLTPTASAIYPSIDQTGKSH